MGTSLNSLAWLLIGLGIGITLGEKESYIILIGICSLVIGFILNFINERKKRI
jgi:general stress protein CsbA